MESGSSKSTQGRNSADVDGLPIRNAFWSAMRVYIEKPHVVNRKICGYQILLLRSRSTCPCVLNKMETSGGRRAPRRYMKKPVDRYSGPESLKVARNTDELGVQNKSVQNIDIIEDKSNVLNFDKSEDDDKPSLCSRAESNYSCSVEGEIGHFSNASMEFLDSCQEERETDSYSCDNCSSGTACTAKRYSSSLSNDHILSVSAVADILHEPVIYQHDSSKLDRISTLFSSRGFEKDCLLRDKNIIWKEVLENRLTMVMVRKIIPKTVREHLLEVILLNGFDDTVTILSEVCRKPPRYLPETSYKFDISGDALNITVLPDLPSNPSSEKWLREIVLARVSKWFLQRDASSKTQPSLNLVDIELYNEVYQSLKNKYAKPLIDMWTESTDPLKFIYEDIAIAAYLIVFWEAVALRSCDSLLKTLPQSEEEGCEYFFAQSASKGLLTRNELHEKELKETQNSFQPPKMSKSLGTALKQVKKQSFIDIGCGNGLLVYILSSEGYEGLGIDIARRKIWDQYPSHVDLRVEAISPSEPYKYSRYQWLIGNHSDELTPWLPVLAARAGETNCFFVIPCCAYDFFEKFRRTKSGLSQYAEYLDYVERVGSACGFKVMKDKLRIPSTKRVCFIGCERTYEKSSRDAFLHNINSFINGRASLDLNSVEEEKLLQRKNNQSEYLDHKKDKDNGSHPFGISRDSLNRSFDCKVMKLPVNSDKSYSSSVCVQRTDDREGELTVADSETSANDTSSKAFNEQKRRFVVREINTKSRNCTQLNDKVRDDLVDCVASFLLSKESIEKVETTHRGVIFWNKGGSLAIPKIISLLSEEQKSTLKRECGGLQTLLRNHHHVFLVKNANVSIKNPKHSLNRSVPLDRIKQKPCWFFRKHPQGCTLSDEECTFKH